MKNQQTCLLYHGEMIPNYLIPIHSMENLYIFSILHAASHNLATVLAILHNLEYRYLNHYCQYHYFDTFCLYLLNLQVLIVKLFLIYLHRLYLLLVHNNVDKYTFENCSFASTQCSQTTTNKPQTTVKKNKTKLKKITKKILFLFLLFSLLIFFFFFFSNVDISFNEIPDSE